MQVDKNLKDKMLFIKKFVTEPRTIGSVTPSSAQLVDSMLCNVDWRRVGAIAELGAGTGVMTREILARKSKVSRLFVFEIDEELRSGLRSETGMEVYEDASFLPEVIRSHGIEKVDLIVSGLPFTVIPRSVTKKVVDGIAESISDQGSFVAFQYSLHMKGAFEKIFEDVSVRFVMMNIPPAFVYECRGVKRFRRQRRDFSF